MSGAIWLIVEDQTDGEVVQQIFKKRGLTVKVNIRAPIERRLHHNS